MISLLHSLQTDLSLYENRPKFYSNPIKLDPTMPSLDIHNNTEC